MAIISANAFPVSRLSSEFLSKNSLVPMLCVCILMESEIALCTLDRMKKLGK